MATPTAPLEPQTPRGMHVVCNPIFRIRLAHEPQPSPVILCVEAIGMQGERRRSSAAVRVVLVQISVAYPHRRGPADVE